jgi:hypothetical protein
VERRSAESRLCAPRALAFGSRERASDGRLSEAARHKDDDGVAGGGRSAEGARRRAPPRRLTILSHFGILALDIIWHTIDGILLVPFVCGGFAPLWQPEPVLVTVQIRPVSCLHLFPAGTSEFFFDAHDWA